MLLTLSENFITLALCIGSIWTKYIIMFSIAHCYNTVGICQWEYPPYLPTPFMEFPYKYHLNLAYQGDILFVLKHVICNPSYPQLYYCKDHVEKQHLKIYFVSHPKVLYTMLAAMFVWRWSLASLNVCWHIYKIYFNVVTIVKN